MVCLGSPQHIKSKFGAGYTLVLNTVEGQVGRAKSFVESALPGSRLDEEHAGYLRYTVPCAGGRSIGGVFGALEVANSECDLLEDYTLTQSSLERVFCRFAAEQAESSA